MTATVSEPVLEALKALVTTIYARPDVSRLLGFAEIAQVKAAYIAIAKATGDDKWMTQ